MATPRRACQKRCVKSNQKRSYGATIEPTPSGTVRESVGSTCPPATLGPPRDKPLRVPSPGGTPLYPPRDHRAATTSGFSRGEPRHPILFRYAPRAHQGSVGSRVVLCLCCPILLDALFDATVEPRPDTASVKHPRTLPPPPPPNCPDHFWATRRLCPLVSFHLGRLASYSMNHTLKLRDPEVWTLTSQPSSNPAFWSPSVFRPLPAVPFSGPSPHFLTPVLWYLYPPSRQPSLAPALRAAGARRLEDQRRGGGAARGATLARPRVRK